MDEVTELLAQKLRMARHCLIETPKDADAVIADIDSALSEFEYSKSIVEETRDLKRA